MLERDRDIQILNDELRVCLLDKAAMIFGDAGRQYIVDDLQDHSMLFGKETATRLLK